MADPTPADPAAPAAAAGGAPLISDEDLAAAVRVMERLSDAKALEALSQGGQRYRQLRKASASYALQLERQKYGGMTYVQYVRKKELEKEKAAKLNRLRKKDREYINSVKLRADRIEALQALIEPQFQAPAITAAGEEHKDRRGGGRAAIEAPPSVTVEDAGPEDMSDGDQAPAPAAPASKKRGKDEVEPSSSGSGDDEAAAAKGGAGAGKGGGKPPKKKKQKRAAEKPRPDGVTAPEEPMPQMHKWKPSQAAITDGAGGLAEDPRAAQSPALEDFVESKSAHHPASRRRVPKPRSDAELQQELDEGNLHFPRSCYVCKVRFHRVHHFYCSLCPDCAALNWAKRNQKADLRGRVVLLTGGRVKIGFEAGRRLLECGATVIITTRFPHDCAKRFSKCEGFDEYKSRLHVFGLDLRDLRSVVRFTELLQRRYHRLDAIVNNAAQTIRRPPAYYRHLLKDELQHPTAALEGVVQQDDLHGTGAGAASALPTVLAPHVVLPDESGPAADAANQTATAEIIDGSDDDDDDDEDVEEIEVDASAAAAAKQGAGASTALQAAAAKEQPGGVLAEVAAAVAAGAVPAAAAAPLMSQVAVAPGDNDHPEEHFPQGRVDVTGQQLDLRPVNSWLLKLDQVDPTELVEVFAVNALAPFILNSRLKPLMMASGRDVDKYIINVSAMEGKFYRHKGPEHPHTNMAKAALNMMTRTSAGDYAKDRIYMNAVDTGWINDENPTEISERIAEENNFQTPIDEMDAMARVIDPILVGVRTGAHPFGQFFKDYHISEW